MRYDDAYSVLFSLKTNHFLAHNFVSRFSLLLFLDKSVIVFFKLLLQFCSDQTHSFFVRKLKIVRSALRGPIVHFHPAFSCKR
jgi:sterol desaturase/sphingolipid hydroxylase (fatty acid hydroxylase superfamily)